jgi:hypothetical protein
MSQEDAESLPSSAADAYRSAKTLGMACISALLEVISALPKLCFKTLRECTFIFYSLFPFLIYAHYLYIFYLNIL